jgi:predicted DNA-binding protein YlxM (UPF0122 family)
MKQTKNTTVHYTLTEAAKKLGISRAAVYKAIKKGSLVAKDRKVIQTKIVKTAIVVKTISEREIESYLVSSRHQDAGKKTK